MTPFSSPLRRRYVLAAFVLTTTPPLAARSQQPGPPALGAPAASVPVAPQPALEAMPARATSGARFTLSLPPGAAAPARVRVALFETGGRAMAGDLRRNARDWQIIEGRARLSLQIDASPGRYELALVTDDKARTRLPFDSAAIEIAGIARTPGWWLPEGSPFSSAAYFQDNLPGTPLFIPGLQRSQGKKIETPDVDFTPEAPFKTLPLEIPTAAWLPAYDATALQAALQANLAKAAGTHERGYWGIEIALQDPPALATLADASRVAASVRQAATAAAPGAALIFMAPGSIGHAKNVKPSLGLVEQAFAARCDAIHVKSSQANLDSILWTTKQARRIAEEQPGYDLPIVVDTPSGLFRNQTARWSGSAQLDVLLAGATGLVRSTTGQESAIDSLFDHDLPQVIERNRSLFINSVTLEDLGVLPAPDGESRAGAVEESPQLKLYDRLREAGRIPLLARLGSDEPESLAVALGNRISDETVRALKSLTERGTRIYIEGAPLLDEMGKAGEWKLKDLVGAEVKPLPNGTARSVDMSLDDGWTFGTGRGTQIGVLQSVEVTLAKPTVGAQVKTEKGIYRPVGARVAAKLADGTPGLIINTVGKGEVVWLPHQIAMPPSGAWTDLRQIPRPSSTPQTRTDAADMYYAAIAAYIQPSLVTLRGAARRPADPTGPADRNTEESVATGDGVRATNSSSSGGLRATYRGAANVRVAMRRSAKGTLLLGLFNDDGNPARVEATVDGAAGLALDLGNDTALPLDVRGFASTATVTIPAHGWSLIAFAKSRDALDAERATPVSRATLR